MRNLQTRDEAGLSPISIIAGILIALGAVIFTHGFVLLALLIVALLVLIFL